MTPVGIEQRVEAVARDRVGGGRRGRAGGDPAGGGRRRRRAGDRGPPAGAPLLAVAPLRSVRAVAGVRCGVLVAPLPVDIRHAAKIDRTGWRSGRVGCWRASGRGGAVTARAHAAHPCTGPRCARAGGLCTGGNGGRRAVAPDGGRREGARDRRERHARRRRRAGARRTGRRRHRAAAPPVRDPSPGSARCSPTWPTPMPPGRGARRAGRRRAPRREGRRGRAVAGLRADERRGHPAPARRRVRAAGVARFVHVSSPSVAHAGARPGRRGSRPGGPPAEPAATTPAARRWPSRRC